MIKITRLAMRGTLLLLVAFALRLVFAATPQGPARPQGPATWGNPNQPWGTRRKVTPSDRARVASYRSGQKQPVIWTTFANDDEVRSQWLVQTDDRSDLKSCRETANVVSTDPGLKLMTLVAGHCHAQYSTGSLLSKAHLRYGFFEASMKIADASGINNAFWLTTEDKFEIDIAEVHYPRDDRITLHNNNNWTPGPEHAVGFDQKFKDDLSAGYHDYGVLWTPIELIFEVDGDPVAAIVTNGSVKGDAVIRFSTALASFAGPIPANPVGHDMSVRSLKVFGL